MPYPEICEEAKAFIDLHGMCTEDAEVELALFINGLPKTIRLVEVAHGYNRGTALKRMVKQDFTHWRVRDKRVGLNPGATYLLLK